jgi:hypothetical protein
MKLSVVLLWFLKQCSLVKVSNSMDEPIIFIFIIEPDLYSEGISLKPRTGHWFSWFSSPHFFQGNVVYRMIHSQRPRNNITYHENMYRIKCNVARTLKLVNIFRI